MVLFIPNIHRMKRSDRGARPKRSGSAQDRGRAQLLRMWVLNEGTGSGGRQVDGGMCLCSYLWIKNWKE